MKREKRNRRKQQGVFMESYSKLIDALKKTGVSVSPEQEKRITEKIETKLSYEPRVGFFGKTGAGKSSLCNALFGQEICQVSDVKACTRAPQEIFLNVASKGIKLVDVPGVGESIEKDDEYSDLYKSIIPELDVVLWVLKGDDRAFSSDELFYNNVVKPHMEQGKPMFFVVNQVDKIEPFREWSIDKHEPGEKQQKNIIEKVKYVSNCFGCPESKIIPVSADEKYHLIRLVDEIVHSLPNDKKITFAKNVRIENMSFGARKESTNAFVSTVIDIIVNILPIPLILKETVKNVLEEVAPWKGFPWNWFK